MRLLPRHFIIGGAVATGAIACARNEWDVNSVGIIRFGRAAFTVILILETLEDCLYL